MTTRDALIRCNWYETDECWHNTDCLASIIEKNGGWEILPCKTFSHSMPDCVLTLVEELGRTTTVLAKTIAALLEVDE